MGYPVLTPGPVGVVMEFKYFSPEKVNKKCTVWKGPRTSKGYGRKSFKVEGEWKNLFLHRVVWEFVYGRKVPPGMIVMHTCDNSSCVNPGHLELGTHKKNIEDRDKKGRGGKLPVLTCRHCGNPRKLIGDRYRCYCRER